MTDENREFICKECGESFPDALSLGRHIRTHKKDKKGVGGTVKKESLLTDDDLAELRETEKSNRQLELEARKVELELRKMKALSEMKKYESNAEPPKERSWVLPDGTSFQGSSADYREMLQIYFQTQAIMKKTTSSEENPTVIKAMLERMAELEKTVSENKMKSIEDKLNYIASRDPLNETELGYKKLAEAAAKLGFTQAGSDLPSKKFALQESAVTTVLKQIDKKLDRAADRTDRLIENFSPIGRRIAEGSLNRVAIEHPEYNLTPSEPKTPEPVPDEKIVNLTKALGNDSETLQEFSTFDLRKYLKDRLRSKHKA